MIDLFCGLGGWASPALAEGWSVVGFDIERHQYGEERYQGTLVLQDVLTLHGSQFRDAALIVASPPCQEYSYMAMPWTRAKEKARQYREGELDVADLARLFNACFRIQREACETAGRHIPLIVENVRGAQPWVGRARWKFGSFYLWGDVPALMPPTFNRAGIKSSERIVHIRDGATHTRHLTNPNEHSIAEGGIKCDGDWFNNEQPSISRLTSSKSSARKAASAMIAKIPAPLARHIARTFLPGNEKGAEEPAPFPGA